MGVSSMSVNILNALNLVNVENLLNLLARTRSEPKSIFQEKEKQDIFIQIAQQTDHALYKTQ